MTPEQSKSLIVSQDYDMAISHAYYAMFYVAKPMLISEGFTSNKHEGIVANFGKYFVVSGKVDRDFQKYLSDGQKKRSESDYDMDIDFDKEEAQTQIERAEKFIELGENFFNPPSSSSS